MPVANQKIEAKSQLSSVGEIVYLYELDLRPIIGEVFRFTSCAVGEALTRATVSFGGNQYSPQPIEVTGYDKTTGQQFARPKMVISNVGVALNSYLQEFDDLVGVNLTRIKTLRQFLDDGFDPDPEARWLLDIYRITKKIVANALRVEFELSSSIDQQGKNLPGRTCLRNACDLTYRRFNATVDASNSVGQRFDYDGLNMCPYAGDEIFDAFNIVVQTPDKDVCGKTLSACQKRFGTNARLPGHFFPGVGRVR